MEYYQGYQKAIRDIIQWISNPQRPLDKGLCKPKILVALLGFIHDHTDEFMRSPTAFCLIVNMDAKKRITGIKMESGE